MKRLHLPNRLSGIDYRPYDKIILFNSGGKDSFGAFFELLEAGVPVEKIEWHHHLIDDPDGESFMDWPVTRDYFKKLAEHFGVEYYFSGRIGGFEAELMKEDAPSLGIWYDDETRTITRLPAGDKPNTRRRWPAKSASLQTRWCSGSLKVDVSDRWIRKSVRFEDGKKYLVITGERAEESPNRAKMETFMRHRTYAGARKTRYIYHARTVHNYTEGEIWSLMQKYGIMPHPAYRLGWNRTSCSKCIFLHPDYWATIRVHDPAGFDKIRQKERVLNHTINSDKGKPRYIDAVADAGTPFDIDKSLWQLAMSEEYTGQIYVGSTAWELPSGAFGTEQGPY